MPELFQVDGIRAGWKGAKGGGEKERAQGGEPGVTGAEVKMLAQMLGPSRRMRLLEADSWLEAG